MASLGQRLREARERKGLSLEEAEASTRIRKAYLVALETEKYDKLPHPTFVRAFLKTYAALLGLDPQEVVELYPHRDQRPPIAPVAKLERPGLGAGFWVASVTFLALVGGLALYLYATYSASWMPVAVLQRGASPAAQEEVEPVISPVNAAVSSAPVVPPIYIATPSPTPSPVRQQVEVHGRATAATWLWVIVDATPVFTGTLQPGQERTWVGQEKVFIRVGNAGGLVVVHNGQDKGVLGKNGQVLDVQWTRDSMSFDINPPLPGPR